MATIALCCLLAAQLALALGVSQGSIAFCESECSVYEEGVLECALQAGCFEEEGGNEEAYVACYNNCNRPAQLCASLCSDNYEVIEGICNDECENSSECSCLHQQFIGRFGHLLPDLVSQNDTAVSTTGNGESEDTADSDDSNDKKDSKSSSEDTEDSDDDSDSDDSKSEDDDRKKRSDSSESEDEDEETDDSDNDEDGPDDPDDDDDESPYK